MNFTRIALCSLAFLLLAGCKAPEAGLVMSGLSDMIGDEVLVTFSQPVALSAIGGEQGGKTNYDTASFLQATLKDVDPSGLVLMFGDREVWVGRESVVSVVGAE